MPTVIRGRSFLPAARPRCVRTGTRHLLVIRKRTLISRTFDAVVPRYRFGSSVYTTPVLLLLRMFYGAAPFREIKASVNTEAQDVCQKMISLQHDSELKLSTRSPSSGARIPTSEIGLGNAPSQVEDSTNMMFQEPRRWTVDEFHKTLSNPASAASSVNDYKVVSLSWVKALASHLSHEYVQFVIEEHPRCAMMAQHNACRRYRLLIDRQDSADYIFTGYDSQYRLGIEPTSYNTLPLPLLSWSFDHLASPQKPTLFELIEAAAQISRGQPEYDALRYNCWWFAETIFERAGMMSSKNVTGPGSRGKEKRLLEWEFSHLRYALILRDGRWVKRRRLARAAEDFRQLNARMMMF